ncbi:MAG TPA: hypothetical protein VG940_03300 [Gemmatimonadales bacterium]|nr:hypothetical protein [Gemmatimonadales bacterium]
MPRLLQGRAFAVLVGIGAGLGGCYEGGVVCTAEAVTGLTLEIRDSVTGVGRAAHALSIAVEGSFADTLDFVDPLVVGDSTWQVGLVERGGTYNVTVALAGYQNWTKNALVIHENACHVEPVRMDVDLVPEP